MSSVHAEIIRPEIEDDNIHVVLVPISSKYYINGRSAVNKRFYDAYKFTNFSSKNGQHMSTFIEGKHIYVHRLVWEFYCGPIPKGMMIDHIDMNPTNNYISNLRLADKSINAQNSYKPKNKYKGVSFVKNDKKWHSKIENKKIVYCLGSYENEEDAAYAYDKKAKEFNELGARYRLNFPDE